MFTYSSTDIILQEFQSDTRKPSHLPMPGAAIRILETHTAAMPFLAAVLLSPNLLPLLSRSVTPSWISLNNGLSFKDTRGCCSSLVENERTSMERCWWCGASYTVRHMHVYTTRRGLHNTGQK